MEDLGTTAAEPRPRPGPALVKPKRGRVIFPWLTELLFVTGVVVLGWIVFLVITSGENPFATIGIPIIIAVTAVVAIVRFRWGRRHRSDTEYMQARKVARERRGF
jgi:hypothetical protein